MGSGKNCTNPRAKGGEEKMRCEMSQSCFFSGRVKNGQVMMLEGGKKRKEKYSTCRGVPEGENGNQRKLHKIGKHPPPEKHDKEKRQRER